ncbi:MAG: hypothetical protein AAB554_02890 [Patescibacteria group bacterium]
MRVIRPNREDPQWKREVECSSSALGDMGYDKQGCGAVLEVTKADLFIHETESGLCIVEVSSFVCPCCGEIMPCGEPFGDLPNYKKWRERQTPPYR